MKLEKKIIILQGFVRRLEREEFYAKAYITDREVLHSYLPRNHRDIALAKRGLKQQLQAQINRQRAIIKLRIKQNRLRAKAILLAKRLQ